MFEVRVLVALSAFVLGLVACNPGHNQLNNIANEAYLSGDYDSALNSYQRAASAAHQSGVPFYNAGNALYRMKEYNESLEHYDASLRHAQGDLRLRGFFNRGNALFQTQQYAQAIEAYKEVLHMAPDHTDSKHNLELALAQIAPPQAQKDEDQVPQQDDQQPVQEDEDQVPQQDDQQPVQEDEDQVPQQTEPLTMDQARQILETVGEDALTLQERRGQVLESSISPAEFDW